MVHITFLVKLLLLVLILSQSEEFSLQCNALQNEISHLEGHILKKIKDDEYKNEIL